MLFLHNCTSLWVYSWQSISITCFTSKLRQSCHLVDFSASTANRILDFIFIYVCLKCKKLPIVSIMYSVQHVNYSVERYKMYEKPCFSIGLELISLSEEHICRQCKIQYSQSVCHCLYRLSWYRVTGGLCLFQV